VPPDESCRCAQALEVSILPSEEQRHLYHPLGPATGLLPESPLWPLCQLPIKPEESALLLGRALLALAVSSEPRHGQCGGGGAGTESSEPLELHICHR